MTHKGPVVVPDFEQSPEARLETDATSQAAELAAFYGSQSQLAGTSRQDVMRGLTDQYLDGRIDRATLDQTVALLGLGPEDLPE